MTGDYHSPAIMEHVSVGGEKLFSISICRNHEFYVVLIIGKLTMVIDWSR